VRVAHGAVIASVQSMVAAVHAPDASRACATDVIYSLQR
jgi:hypothetical protein